MPSTTHISEETMRYNSVLATQSALVELGQQKQSKLSLEKLQEINNKINSVIHNKYIILLKEPFRFE